MRRDVFQAIADPIRREIIVLLADRGMTPRVIAEHFKVTRQAISKHLRILIECDLVYQVQNGRKIIYRLNVDKLLEIDQWMDQLKEIWKERFNELDRVLFIIKNYKNEQHAI